MWVLVFSALLTLGATSETVTIASTSSVALRGTEVKITCKYTTAGFKANSLRWFFKGVAFTGAQLTGVKAGTAEGANSVAVYTIAKVAKTDVGAYTCRAEFGEKKVTSPAAVDLKVIDVTMTATSPASAVGSKITITCNYDQPTGVSAPTIAWLMDAKDFSAEMNKLVSLGDNCGDVQRSRYIIDSADPVNTGKYKCKATYIIGGKTATLEPEAEQAFYVREVTTTAKVFHVEVGGSLNIVCTVKGDNPDTFKWYTHDDKSLPEGLKSESGTYGNNMNIVTLKITNAKVATHEKSFKCKASWAKTDPKTLEVTAEVKVYDVTGIKDAAAVELEPGKEFKITCKFEAGASEVTWYRSTAKLGDALTGAAVKDKTELVYTVAKVAAADSGTYKCSVKYGVNSVYTGRQTKSLKVRGVTADATTHASIGTSKVTLTCVFYGDEMNAAEWFKTGSATKLKTDETKYKVTAGSFDGTENKLTTTLAISKIATADAAAYTCKTTYKKDSKATQSVQTLSALIIPVITSSDKTVTNANPVTLTCTYSAAPKGATLKVTLSFGETDLSSKLEKKSDTSHIYKIAKAGPADSGKYKCKVSYGKDYTDVTSAEFEQFVRDVAAGASSTNAVDGVAKVILTCIFRGDALGATTWTKTGTSGALKGGEDTYGIKAGTYSSYVRTDKLEILKVGTADAGEYTCEATYTDGSKKTSVKQTLKVLAISSVASSSTQVGASSPFTLTCTHSALDAGLEVTWTVNDKAISKGIAADGNTKSVLTVSQAKKEDNGKYKCSVKFGAFGTTSKEITQYVRFAEAPAAATAIVGDATHKLTCVFYGDGRDATVWTFGDKALAKGNDYDIEAQKSDFSTTDILTIKTVDATNAGTYKCSVKYTSDKKDSSKEIPLTVYGTTKFASSAATIDSGGAFTITCDYSVMKTGGPATVAWFKNDKAISTGIKAASATSSVYTKAAATKDDNGEYQCKVTFGKVGTASSAKITQYVRYVTPAKTVYGVTGKDIEIVCVFYGDALGATTWTKGATVITTGGQYTITAGTYTNQMRTDTLKIKTLTTANNGEYNCKASYTAGAKETSSKQTLSVIAESLDVTVSRTPSTTAVDEGVKVTFTCTYTARTMGANDGTIKLAWKKNDEPVTGTDKKLEVTADASKNGVYKCVVTYGILGDISNSNTLLVRAVEYTKNVYAMNGEKVTLSCKAYGDAPTSIKWNDGGEKDLTKADNEVTDTAYANYFVESKFAIASASASKNYKCKVQYNGKLIQQTTALAVSKAISVPTLKTDGEGGTNTPNAKTELKLQAKFTASSAITSGDKKVTLQLLKEGTKTAIQEKEITAAETTKHVFTLTNLATSATGKYTIKATYGSFGSKQSTPPYQLFVRAVSEGSTKTVAAGTKVSLTCKFDGDELSKYAWTLDGGEGDLKAGDKYEIPSATWSATTNSLTTTLVVKSISNSDKPQVYKCKGTYKKDSKFLEASHTITVLGAKVESNAKSNTVNAGTPVEITCSYDKNGEKTSTVEWLKDGKAVTSGADYTIDNTKASSQKSILKLTKEQSKVERNGVYKCKVTFKDIGAHEVELTQYVQSAAASVLKSYSAPKATVTLSCVFYGKLKDAASKWYKGTSKTAIGTDSSYTVTPGTLDGYKRTDKLIVKTVDALDSDTYKCDISDLTLSATQEFHVISIETDPANAVAEATKTTTMSCVTGETKLVITDITWLFGAEKDAVKEGAKLTSAAGSNSGYKKFTSTLTITGSKTVSSNDYECVVKMPNDDKTSFKVTSKKATFYRIGDSSNSVTGYTGKYIESDGKAGEFSENYTVTFNVFKGPGIASVTGKFVDTASKVTVVTFAAGAEVAAAEGTGAKDEKVVPYSYTPKNADQKTGKFSVEIVYTGFAKDKFSSEKSIYVYSYCKTATLPKVTNGAWSPATKVDYKGYATLACSTGYFVEGDSVASCGTAAAFSKTTSKCTSSTGLTCGNLPNITNGYATYINSSNAKYECNTGYALLSTAETYTCDSTTGKWSIVTSSNPSGTPPKCEVSTSASKRSIDFTVNFPSDTEYCKDAAEDKKVEDALKAFLLKDNLVACLVESQCEMKSYDCSWAAKKLTIKFTLNQLVLLSDASILSDASSALASATFSLTVSTTGKRSTRVKRSDLSFSSGAVSSKTDTTCGADYLTVNGACVQCPAGYGESGGVCVACAKGYYSDVKSKAVCTKCAGTTTTMSTGSTKKEDCVDPKTLCTVPAAPENGALVPPPGSSVKDGANVTVACVSGYAVTSGMPTKFACTGSPKAPLCYLECPVSYNDTALKDLNINAATVKNVTKLSHEGTMHVSCEKGYETDCKKDYDIYTCIGNKGAPKNKMVLNKCTKKPVNAVLILAVVAAIVIIAIIAISLWCNCKQRKERSRSAPVTMPMGKVEEQR